MAFALKPIPSIASVLRFLSLCLPIMSPSPSPTTPYPYSAPPTPSPPLSSSTDASPSPRPSALPTPLLFAFQPSSPFSKGDAAFILVPPSLNVPIIYLTLLSLGVVDSPAISLSFDSEIAH
ncbi:hypothetical protein CDL15_Pgr008058 [Punica granatum]|uniref:Uncharacterized protein n=1 Tax=Punica granatum TaxID=22663 RepID=A0A218VT98_PUNGR|nr:hypothetical protein CDL15_Pgr008058 [Punica granatum]